MEHGDRAVAALFGLLGAVLIALEGLLDLVRSVIYLAVGRGGHSYQPFDQGVIFLVLGLIIAVFSILGVQRHQERTAVAGAVLIVVAVFGWVTLGLGSGLLAILGAILVMVGGVVFLVSGL